MDTIVEHTQIFSCAQKPTPPKVNFSLENLLSHHKIYMYKYNHIYIERIIVFIILFKSTHIDIL